MAYEQLNTVEGLAEPIRFSTRVHQSTYELEGETFPCNVDWEETYEFPIQKLDEQWLLEEAIPEEADQLLEGWLDGYQQHFTNPKDSSIAQQHEIERPLQPQVARMMAYLALADEYFSMRDARQSEIDSYEMALKEKREEINSAVKENRYTKGRGQKERAQLEYDHKEKVSQPAKLRRKSQAILDLISRKYICEQFGPQDGDDDFRLTPDSFFRTQDEVNEISQVHESKVRFLSQITQVFNERKDPVLQQSYRYKVSEGLSRNLADCQALSMGMKMALGIDIEGEDDQVLLQHLGESFLSFVSGRALDQSIRRLPLTQTNPILETTYDILSAAMTISHSTKLSIGLPQVLEKTMGNMLKSSQVPKESARLAKEFLTSADALIGNHAMDLLQIKTTPLEKIHPDIIQFTISDLKRMIDAYRFTLKLLFSMDQFEGPFQENRTMREFYNLVQQGFKPLLPALKIWRQNEVETIGNITSTNMYRALGIPVDLANSMATHRGAIDSLIGHFDQLNSSGESSLPEAARVGLGHMSTSPSFPEFVKKISETGKSALIPPDATEWLSMYSRYYLQRLNEGQQKVIEGESQSLGHHILNTSKWFVSPRGDRFDNRNDRELAAQGIDAITFMVDPRYPREHRVVVQLRGLDQEINLWIDTKTQLLNENHELLNVDPQFKLTFSNLILRRLCFITSGILAQPQEEHDQGVDGGPNFTYKRAHYNILTNPRFTMTSDGARMHADEIWEEYGIDIFRERDRRRRIGVIGPSDHLTFVRETNPDVMPEQPVPNTIIFDPDLLQKHLLRHRLSMME